MNWSIYGRLPLMISAQCLAKTTRGCDKKSGIYQLRDRKGTEFCVKCQCRFCYNIIYNSVPVSLFPELEAAERLGAGGWRLSFTLEGKEETRRVLREFLGAGSGADKKSGRDALHERTFSQGRRVGDGMVHLIVELSKYFLMILMLLYSMQCFSIVRKKDEVNGKTESGSRSS